MSYWLKPNLVKPLDAYRARRKIELGRIITRQTAIDELIAIALDQQPKQESLPSYCDLVERVNRLETWAEEHGYVKSDV